MAEVRSKDGARSAFLCSLCERGPDELFQELDQLGDSEPRIRVWARRWNLKAGWLIQSAVERFRGHLLGRSWLLDLPPELPAKGAGAFRFQADWEVRADPSEEARRVQAQVRRAIARHRQDVEALRVLVHSEDVPNMVVEFQVNRTSVEKLARRTYGDAWDGTQDRVAREIRAYLQLIDLQPRAF